MTDGERLYVWFGSRGIFCFDLGGKLLWKRDLGDMRSRYGWGEATSPVVHGEDVIINWDHEDQSFLAALNAKTGETRWKVDRDEVTSWATPLVVEHDGATQIVVNGTKRARGYSLEDGKELWACGGQTVNAIPSPVRLGENVIVMSGYTGSTAVSIPLSARGDITGTKTVRWEVDEGTPYVPSPLLVGERLYFTRKNRAILTCINARTGERIYGPERLPGIRSLYASPVAAAGRVYFVGRDGNAVVLKDGDAFKVLAENKLEAAIDASPAIVGGQMFLRGRSSLYCIAEE
jgi:outer membrane protein assembly factor BamB